MTALAELIRSERRDLVGYLETLTPEQWTTPSLCGEWTVQNVAAHLAWAPVVGALEALPMLVRSGFRTNRFIADSAIAWSERGRDAILEQLRDNATTNAKPLGMPRVAGLVDAIVHGLDIRVPLGAAKPVDPEAFRVAADWLVGVGLPLSMSIGGKPAKRLRDVRLVATDLDWAWGAGREVAGTSDELMLVLTGRSLIS